MHLQAVGRRLRRLRAVAVDRARDDGHEVPARAADARPLRGRARLPDARSRPRRSSRSRRLVNAFFRWEFNSCEMLVRGGERLPDRLRQRLPGRRAHLAALLLPVGDEGAAALVGVLRGHRPARRASTSTPRPYFEVGDRDDLATRRSSPPTAGWPTTTSRPSATRSSARPRSPHVDEMVLDWVASPEFDALLLDTVRRPTRRTSTSASSRTSAACSACGWPTSGACWAPTPRGPERWPRTSSLPRP